ncbi:TIGR03943 family putative permease subunit [Micromonosporaceae bacterium Da 78-11]
MSRPVQAFVLIMLGTVLARLVITGEYLNYVRPGLGPYLVAAGIVFVVLGALGFVRDYGATEKAQHAAAERHARGRVHTRGPLATTQPPAEHAHGHGYDDWYGHATGWLVCVPLFVLLVVPPPALGSYAAGRAGATAPSPAGRSSYSALPAADPAALTVRDYAMRAVWDHGRTLSGRRVVLVGFVAASVGDLWYATRLHIVCCAADAIPAKVQVIGSGRRPPTGQWVAVTGGWIPSDANDLHGTVARIQARDLRTVRRPADPYE